MIDKTFDFFTGLFDQNRKVFLFVFIVLISGWPAQFFIDKMEQWQMLPSPAAAEQISRKNEHLAHYAMIQSVQGSVRENNRLNSAILSQLEAQTKGAAADRNILSFYTWKECIRDNGKGAKICARFEKLASGD